MHPALNPKLHLFFLLSQSNSVCYAVGGQIVGVGAGQQSRVDCVKLAGRKVDTWHARLHPKVRKLPFKDSVKVSRLLGIVLDLLPLFCSFLNVFRAF